MHGFYSPFACNFAIMVSVQNVYRGFAVAKEHVHDVFQSVAEQYDAANDRISFGMHRRWKQMLVDRAVAASVKSDPGMVLDVCCGTGDITNSIARNNPGVYVVGLDFSEEMLKVAQQRMMQLENVTLIEGNALDLPFDDDLFDAAVISFGLRNTPNYKVVIDEMVRVVRPGGVVACLDASVPENKVVLPFYDFYYKNIMTLLGGGISKHSEYEWLYQSTKEFLTKDELEQLFRNCGLEYVTVRSFMFGAAALHVGVVPYTVG